MLSIPGQPGSTCDGFSRRELLRIGGAGLFGVSLADVMRLQALAAEKPASEKHAPGWGRQNLVLLFLGGPSHIDIWDPKPDARQYPGRFQAIRSKLPGVWLRETMPKLAKVLDKTRFDRSATRQRSVQSYRGDLSDDDRLHAGSSSPSG